MPTITTPPTTGRGGGAACSRTRKRAPCSSSTWIWEVTQVVTRHVEQTEVFLPLPGLRSAVPDVARCSPELYVDAVRHAAAQNFDVLFVVLPDEAFERLLALMDGELVLPPSCRCPRAATPSTTRTRSATSTSRPTRPPSWQAALAAGRSGRSTCTRRSVNWPSRSQGGPVRITGSAGTGKTVVALHRVAQLARSSPDRGGGAAHLIQPNARLRAWVRSSRGSGWTPGGESSGWTVVNLHRLASRLVPGAGALPHTLVRDDDLARHLAQAGGGRPEATCPPPS